MRCDVCEENVQGFFALPGIDETACVCPTCLKNMVKFARVGRMVSSLGTGAVFVNTREGYGLSNGKREHVAAKTLGELVRLVNQKAKEKANESSGS